MEEVSLTKGGARSGDFVCDGAALARQLLHLVLHTTLRVNVLCTPQRTRFEWAKAVCGRAKAYNNVREEAQVFQFFRLAFRIIVLLDEFLPPLKSLGLVLPQRLQSNCEGDLIVCFTKGSRGAAATGDYLESSGLGNNAERGDNACIPRNNGKRPR